MIEQAWEGGVVAEVAGERLMLLAERAAYWERRRTHPQQRPR